MLNTARVGFDARTWLRWTGVFLLFPPAGLLARAVAGPANNFGTAPFSGAIAGVLIGAGMWKRNITPQRFVED